MPELRIEIVEGRELAAKFRAQSTVQKPLDANLKRLALVVERHAKMATVVDTGRLRASITHAYGPNSVLIGSNVDYAPFIEYGTRKMDARHMEGTIKVLGEGMFSYAVGTMGEELEDFGVHFVRDFEGELS